MDLQRSKKLRKGCDVLVTALEIVSLERISKTLEGRLLRREEIPYESSTIDYLLTQQYLMTKTSITKKLLLNQCLRCGNKKKNLFANIPCRKCNQTHLYCRKCIEMGRILECEPLYYWNGPKAKWPRHHNPCSWEGQLTDAQQQAADRIVTSIINRENEILVWAVCGAGKTEMLFPGITTALKQGMRICIATPRADVVRELKPRLEKAFETVKINALYGGSKEKLGDAQIIIATTHQLLRFQEAFDCLIIDELDAFPFHADPSLSYAANRSKMSVSTTIYLTATPRKQEQERIRQGKLPHVFVPVRYHGNPLPVPKMKISFSLRKSLMNSKTPETFLSWLKRRENPQRQLLIFVPTIQLTEKLKPNLTKMMFEQGIIRNNKELDFVHSEDTEREEKVNAFRNKDLKVIVTTTILERGVTFPSVDVAIIDAGHDVFDEAALVQIAGRAGRSADDPTGEVIFFHDGKTEAMVSAVYMIKQMNKRGGFY